MIWKIQWNFRYFIWFLNQCSLYYSIQLGRCVLFSLAALGAILILRYSVLKKTIFLKGILWSIFLLVPFVGKLKLFYNNIPMGKLFMWWNNGCIKYPAIRYGYLLGVIISGGFILRRHIKLHRQVKNMKKAVIDNIPVYITEMSVTSFATGAIHPKIIIPKVMEDEFEKGELQTVLLHEKTHIRLGHLWIYLLWDILRMLLWINPLVTYCVKYLKEDMEEICDKVTIQKGSGIAYEYGQILLKSIKLLKAENVHASAAFVGENDYHDLKRRFTKVVEYKPYQKCEIAILYVFCVLLLVGGLTLIKVTSYPKYIEETDITLQDGAGKIYILYDNEERKNAVYADGQNIYIDKVRFQNILRECGIDENIEYFWLGFGGYTKLPGFGGNINLAYIDYGQNETKLIVPYKNREDHIFEYIFKNII